MTESVSGSQQAMLQQQRVLAAFGALALKSQDLDEILQEACRLVGQALHTDLAKVMELQEDRKTLLVRAGVGWKPGVVGHATVKASIDSSEGHALQTHQAVTSDDITTETRFVYPQFLKDNGVHALVNVIILGPEGHPPYGILEVDSRVPRHFTENDISFLQTYANMVATAVHRLHLMDALRETAKEKERLLLELQHRIKNNLQVITALISTQSRRSTSPEVKEELKSIEDRVETLRLVHDKLYSAGEVDRVDLASYLAELAGGLLKFHRNTAHNIRLRLEVARVHVAPETAIPLGLIVNEFVTNSMKYAFEDRSGLVGLELVTNGANPATLTLWDDGKGFVKLPPGGTGMRLINGLLSQLHTKGQWRGEQGVRLVFERPCAAMIR
ncbi:sensor histidine kinase [Pseudomonas syringae]|uniref:sensor histidine kinase n=1 Tax=Pseudomonas syringae TaxID=317 RepID=UPI0018E604B7|nr:histidine kinase dimerization/phosphoacceptor domain -containing protein [Pseudomonas syringae]MBI6743485.1 GAF domain-containing protein [Pseudomonas syringae]MBI6758868.1 GAF domain-containing protein [Pseudomonas syringae]MBI6828798.1 GAF domain-containing protein [Pseudomonas syringae]